MSKNQEEIGFYKKLEDSLANEFGLTDLSSGNIVIRDKKGWRENEKSIDYIWVIVFHHAFGKDGGIINIKYNESKFREITNPEELLEGVFLIQEDGNIKNVYIKKAKEDQDFLDEFKSLDYKEANKGITIDGISYRIHLLFPNTDVVIKVNNPNHQTWKKWEEKVWNKWDELSSNSNDEEKIKIFDFK